MKNYTLNKKLFGWLPLEVLFLLFTTLMMTVFISSIVWAQSEAAVSSDNKKSVVTTGSNSLQLGNYRPYLVRIIDGNTEITVSTTYKNPADILKSTNLILYSEDEYTITKNADFNSEPLVGYRIVIDRATPVEFNLRGSSSNIRTQSNTVADLLKEKGVVLGANDVVKPALDAKLNRDINVSIFKVGTQTITTDEVLLFTKTYIDDSTLATSAQVVSTPGKDGLASVTYRVTYYDGKEVSRQKIRSVTLKQPTNEVVRRGPVNTRGPLSTAQIQFLGSCEAGMSPTRNSGNSYYGAFQFSVDTWNAMGTGYARADLAPLDVQIQAVQQLLSRSSIFGQFPSCANQMVAAGLL